MLPSKQRRRSSNKAPSLERPPTEGTMIDAPESAKQITYPQWATLPSNERPRSSNKALPLERTPVQSTMFDAPESDNRTERRSPYNSRITNRALRMPPPIKIPQSPNCSLPSSSTRHKLALAVDPFQDTASVASNSTRGQKEKVALAVDPYQVAMSVTASSSVLFPLSPPTMLSPPSQMCPPSHREQQEVKPQNSPPGLPSPRRRRSPREPPVRINMPLRVARISPLATSPIEPQRQWQPLGRTTPLISPPEPQAVHIRSVAPLEPATSLRRRPFERATHPRPVVSPRLSSCDSLTTATSTTTWHDERLMKSLTYSDTFQKRLEEQAAEAIRKAEEKTVQEFEKKLKNCLKTIEAIDKRKKNDLRLVELRKKTEMEKIEEEFQAEIEREKDLLFKEEQEKLREAQDALKAAVLMMKRENSEFEGKCRQLADRNKQLMAEIDSSQKVQQEVEQHSGIVSQLDGINDVFKQAHATAVGDMKRLEADCKREGTERNKIQKWIASLIALMDLRCNQPKLLYRIHKLDDRCKAQRELVIDLRRARQRSSKRSQRSGTTTVLRRRVKDMRKQAKEKNHILEDRAKLTAELAQRRAWSAKSRKEEVQRQQRNLKRRQNLQKRQRGTRDEKTGKEDDPPIEDLSLVKSGDTRVKSDSTDKDDSTVEDSDVSTDDIETARVDAQQKEDNTHAKTKQEEKAKHENEKILSVRASRKMSKRREEIQKILVEMRKLDYKEDPPAEIFI